MKILKKCITAFIALIAATYFCWAEYYAADFMDFAKAEKKWGVKTLDQNSFRTGNPIKRAPMAVDIVKRQLYVGKDKLQVRKELGDPDSYFFSDTIYAYKIMDLPGVNKENWHLVFIPDDKLEKVKEVKIHKKCCYKSPL